MNENGLHKITVMRQALEGIQELHRSVPIYTTWVSNFEHDSCEDRD